MTSEAAPPDSSGVRRTKYLTYGASYTAPTVVRVCGQSTTCGTTAESRTEYTYWGATALPLTETRKDLAANTVSTTTYAYDDAGRVLAVDGPLPGADDASYFRYDVLGRKTWEIGPRGANGLRVAKRHTYRDADDKLIATEAGTVTDPTSVTLTPINRTDMSYDARRNPLRETLSVANVPQSVVDRSHDLRGRLVCQTQRMNLGGTLPADACTVSSGASGPDRITRNTYDAASQLLLIQKAYGTPLQQNYAAYTYSPNGKQTSVTDANGNLASLAYDGFDRLKQWTFPSKTTPGQLNPEDFEAYTYDAAGNRTSLRKRDGVVIGHTYDGLNRVTSKTVPASVSGVPGYSIHYGYDVQGQQVYARFGSATGEGVSSVYDGLSRLTSSTSTMGGVTRTLSYQHDLAGRRTKVTHPDGAGFDMSYDGAARMATLSLGGSVLASFGYDAKGLPSTLARGPTQSGWTHDGAGRLTALSHVTLDAAIDVSYGFQHNPAGQITQRTLSNPVYTWNGDVALTRAYEVNGLNQYTSAGPATFLYDANGNLTSDGSMTLAYDAENRLVSVAGTRNAALAYDPLGRLHQVTDTASGAVTRFLYDGDELVAEYDASGTMLRRYVHGANVDDPLFWYEGAGTDAGSRRQLLSDHQGSIVAIATADGYARAVNSYDPWGIPAEANVGRFQYTGQAWLSELGMYHYKARIYSPTLGRFLQTDPIGYDDQVNLYAYVANDPVNRTDPTGMEKTGCGSHIRGHVAANCSGDTILGTNGQSMRARSQKTGRVTHEQANSNSENRNSQTTVRTIDCDALCKFIRSLNHARNRIEGVLSAVGDTASFIGGTGVACGAPGDAPCNLQEQLAIDSAMGSYSAIRIMQGKIKDPNYPENVWGKFRYTHQSLSGYDIYVHFWRNLVTGAEHGFKIKR